MKVSFAILICLICKSTLAGGFPYPRFPHPGTTGYNKSFFLDRSYKNKSVSQILQMRGIPLQKAPKLKYRPPYMPDSFLNYPSLSPYLKPPAIEEVHQFDDWQMIIRPAGATDSKIIKH